MCWVTFGANRFPWMTVIYIEWRVGSRYIVLAIIIIIIIIIIMIIVVIIITIIILRVITGQLVTLNALLLFLSVFVS